MMSVNYMLGDNVDDNAKNKTTLFTDNASHCYNTISPHTSVIMLSPHCLRHELNQLVITAIDHSY